MTDDELLDMLGEVARGERDSEPDSEAAQALLEPLGDDAKDRFAAAAMAAMGPPEDAKAPPDDAKVIPFRRRALTWVVPLAAAAAVTIFLLRPAAPTFTAYQLDATAGEQRLRSGTATDGGERPRYADDSGFELVLRPATRIEGPVALRAFTTQGAAVTPWAPPVQAAPGGSFRISGDAGTLLPGLRGEVELLFAVGPEALLPSAANVRAALDAPPTSWRLLRYRLVRE